MILSVQAFLALSPSPDVSSYLADQATQPVNSLSHSIDQHAGIRIRSLSFTDSLFFFLPPSPSVTPPENS